MACRALICLTGVLLTVPAMAMADSARFNITAQPLAAALKQFAEQAHMQILYRFDAVSTATGNTVSGNLDKRAALEQLLKNTGLEAVYSPDNAATIRPIRANATSQETAPPPPIPPTNAADQEKSLWDRFQLAQADQGATASTAAVEKRTEQTSRQEPGRLEEIIVTAQKREERLQEVPSSVSALTGATLEAMGAESFTDYARSIPGLTFQDLGAGRQLPTLRGINPTVGAVAVTYYIGETPMPTASGVGAVFEVNPALIDIDRIEVLRGPQGTLYGSSSIGGTIRLIPNAPNLSQFEGSVKGEALVTQGADGASPGAQTELVLNVPIAQDLFAVRGAFWYRNDGGFINRTWTNAGTAGIATGPVVGTVGNLPDEHTWGFRTVALAQPTEQLSVSAMAYLQHQHFDGFTDITGGASNPNDRLVQNLISDTPEPQDNEFSLYNLTVKYGFGRFNVISSTSYSEQEWNTNGEGTSAIQVLPEFYGQPPGSVVVPNVSSPHGTNYNFTEEARLATTESIAGFDALVGVFHSRVHAPNYLFWYPPNYNALVAGNDPANPLYAPNGNVFSSSGAVDTRETSEFGEVTYHVTNSLSLTGGMRHYSISDGTDAFSSGLFVNGNVPAAPVELSVSSSSKGNVYKGNLSYQLTPDHLLYAQYSEGFRPGIANPPLPPPELEACGLTASEFREINPDSIKSYELGAKTAWLDQRLIINAAAYRINWSDIQQGLQLPCGAVVGTNFGSAVIKGGELELRAQLTRRVGVGLSATYLHTEIQQDEPLLMVDKGDPILAVPKWQYAPYVETTFPLLQADDGFARLDYQYTGSSTGSYIRLSDGAFDPTYEVQVVRLLNLRAGMRRQAWEFAVSGTNLLNNTVRQSTDPWANVTFAIPGRPRYVITRPRTFSVSATYAF